MIKQLELTLVIDTYNLYGDRYSKQRLSTGLLFNDYIEAPVIRRLIGKKSRLSNSTVLDIGCGPGVYTKLLLHAGASVVAIDSSAVMLKSAYEHCSSLPPDILEKCQFIESSFEMADFGDKKFDLIIATFMISYFEDLTFALEKMRMHLSKKGKIIASMLHPIRMFAKSKTDEGYVVENYFENGFYHADFLDENSSIYLKRYNFEQLHFCINEAGLKIEQLIEPVADLNCGYHDRDKVEFYAKNPSVLIFQMEMK
ncbi:MAG: hypothetical protein RL748_2195 [Pseudomonadota bacterium]|jgi:ubiquinone/menaquinone biosynthesis C-methylase UbiE